MHSIEGMQADVTVLIIAHRLSTLKKCNRVFEINSQGLREIAADSIGRLTNNIGASEMKVG
jgi:ABC-type multidrug transport system fused ATPase/permease subunit